MVQFLLEVTKVLDRTTRRKSIVLLFTIIFRNLKICQKQNKINKADSSMDFAVAAFSDSECRQKREKKVVLRSRKGKKKTHKARKTRRKMGRDQWRGWVRIGRRMARGRTVDEQVLKIPWKMNLTQVQGRRIRALGLQPMDHQCEPKSVTNLR